MEPNKAEVIDQIRELNMLLIQSKLHVFRTHFSQGRIAGRVGDHGERTLPAEGTLDVLAATRVSRTSQPEQQAPCTQEQRAAEELDDLPAYHGQNRLLSVLGLHPDASEVTQRDLGYILGMSRQAVGELLSKLEAKGFVTRRASDEDKRTMVVSLTDKGRQAAEHVREFADSGSDVLSCLSPEELAQFSGYLQRIIDNAESKADCGDEFAERRKAMREFLSLNHVSPDAEGGA